MHASWGGAPADWKSQGHNLLRGYAHLHWSRNGVPLDLDAARAEPDWVRLLRDVVVTQGLETLEGAYGQYLMSEVRGGVGARVVVMLAWCGALIALVASFHASMSAVPHHRLLPLLPSHQDGEALLRRIAWGSPGSEWPLLGRAGVAALQLESDTPPSTTQQFSTPPCPPNHPIQTPLKTHPNAPQPTLHAPTAGTISSVEPEPILTDATDALRLLQKEGLLRGALLTALQLAAHRWDPELTGPDPLALAPDALISRVLPQLPLARQHRLRNFLLQALSAATADLSVVRARCSHEFIRGACVAVEVAAAGGKGGGGAKGGGGDYSLQLSTDFIAQVRACWLAGPASWPLQCR